MYVWLTEDAVGREVYGIFTSAEKAREVCQASANEFFGEKTTKPLRWIGDESYVLSASYEDPGGRYLFVITRYTVDERKEY